MAVQGLQSVRSKVGPASGGSTPSNDCEDYDDSAAPSRHATSLANPDEVSTGRVNGSPELESDRALAELAITGADVLDQHEFINHPLMETIGSGTAT